MAKPVLSGIGQSAVGRNLGRSGIDLTVDATLAAVHDAGLTLADIDGITCWPGREEAYPGHAPVGVRELKEALRLELNWYSGGPEGPGQLGSVFNAMGAVSAGFSRHVLCFRTLTESSAQNATRRASVLAGSQDRVTGEFEWHAPFNAVSAAILLALYAQRHMHEFGTTREHLGHIALTCRNHAALNPKAVFRSPLTMDDYLAARMISTPFGLYDCDVPVDGSTAVVVSDPAAVPDLRHPVVIEAAGAALHGRHSWEQWADLTTMAAVDAADSMWRKTELGPGDVDVAELYDGFSFLALSWLEALGFCKQGEGGPFLEQGRTIALDGPLPLNTDGGQLSAGRLHGFGLLHEACLQVRQEATGRQVPGARVAVVAAGGGPLAGCLLLRQGER
jgi:acetyl-CoA acetyltransferase